MFETIRNCSRYRCAHVFQDFENSQQSSYYGQLTTKFSEWFYSLINNPISLGPEHFFIDAQMKIALEDQTSSEVIEAATSADVAQALYTLQMKYRLGFLPNLSPDAIKYQTSAHGQIMLMVCGSLQSLNVSQIVGLFEQMFLLLRDGSDNANWKIKNSHMRLRLTNNAVLHDSPKNNMVTCT